MKKKISKLQIVRHLVQILFFILLPGLFTLAFSQIKLIYTMIIKGELNFIDNLPRLVAVISIIPITIIFGRFFCGWMCAFGSYNDFIYMISKKVFKTNFKVPEKVDKVLKYAKYVVLLFIVIFMWTQSSELFNNASPWDAFAQMPDILQVLQSYIVGLIFLVGISIGAFFIDRFFCRYLCPLGAIFTILSKLRIVRIQKPSDKCGKCRICTNNCSMGIDLYKVDKVNSGECIYCFNCLDVCPRKNTHVTIAEEKVNSTIASSMAIVAFTGLYTGSSAVAAVVSNNTTSISASAGNSSTAAKYKDGTYTGTGNGFRPNLKVSVTVKNSKITNVEVISDNESRGYKEQPIKVIPEEIISAQSTTVDAVSGATRTSNGIMMAVEDALSQALITTSSGTTAPSSDTTTSDSSAASSSVTNSNSNTASSAATADSNKAITDKNNAAIAQSTEQSSTQNSTTSNATSSTTNGTTAASGTTQSTTKKYKDGTYTGTGTGYRPGLTVSVVVKDDKIVSVQLLSTNDSRGFYETPAQVIPEEIVKSQSTKVDAVSGATRSSNGIMMAVEDALAQAKI